MTVTTQQNKVMIVSSIGKVFKKELPVILFIISDTNNGTVVKSVNQNNYYNAWVNLGTYSFSSGRAKRVRLTDATGETNYNLKIGFDAVKFTPQ